MGLQNHGATEGFSPIGSWTGAQGLPHPVGDGMPPGPKMGKVRRKGKVVENEGKKRAEQLFWSCCFAKLVGFATGCVLSRGGLKTPPK